MHKASSIHADLTIRLTPISDTAALDASVLLAHVLNKPRAWVMAHPELKLTDSQQKELGDSLVRLQAGEPLPYILGRWEFFGLEFEITPDVLIPRPETELLVEKAISWLRQSPQPARNVADVGTGSGAIAVSIAIHVPDAKIIATDISPKALDVAKTNAQKFKVNDKITFIECDLLPYSPGEIDLLCANLPYIPTAELHNLSVYNREPSIALDGGEDGLTQIRKLLQIAPGWLARNGLILLEIEASQGSKAYSLASEMLPKSQVELHKDLAGRDRLISLARSSFNI